MLNTSNDIFVTKPFMPPKELYDAYIQKIWKNEILTNQGPLLVEFEKKMSKFLQAKHFHFLQNGTVALQLAIKALGITSGEIITTPFTYVATSSSILWQNCTPIFVDIESSHFTMDVSKIEKAITKNTKAILPVHVFGHACDVEALSTISQQYNLKLIYDAAHAFAVRYKGKSLLNYGDISTLSFHTTKLFHTVEGGACLIHDNDISERISYMKRFGHFDDLHIMSGINAKNSEFHAAMGLANFPYINEIIEKRKHVTKIYDENLCLSDYLQKPKKQKDLDYNYAYYPVLFKNENTLQRVFNALAKERIFPRRYFYPSLNTLPYVSYTSCPVSEDICSRIACLPLYPELSEQNILRIAKTINNAI